MDNPKLGGCFTVLALLSSIFVCIAFFAFGQTAIWVTVVTGIMGFGLGRLLGKSIGIAGGGTAGNGSMLLGSLLALVFVLIGNVALFTSGYWWNSTPWLSRGRVAPIVQPEPTSGWWDRFLLPKSSPESTAPIATPFSHGPSYQEIEQKYSVLDSEAWSLYRISLIGQEIEWEGVVDAKKENEIDFYLGQDKLKRRIMLAGLSPRQLNLVEVGDFILVQGRIQEINQILGLNITIADIELKLTSPRSQ